MKGVNLFFQLLFILIQIVLSSFIKEKYETIKGIYHIVLKIDSLNLINYIEMDLNISYLWVSDLNFEDKDFEDNKILGVETIFIENKFAYLAKIIKGKISFDESPIIIDSFNFYYINRVNNKIYDTIGFSFQTENETFSLIHQLKKNNYIDRLSFGFVPDKEFNARGTIYFGSIPEGLIFNKQNVTCEIKNNWGCNINEVIFKKKTFNPSNNYSILDTKTPFIIVEPRFFEFLEEEYFKEYLANSTCYYKSGYFCHCDLIDYYPTISIILNGYQFKLEKFDLFSKEFKICQFMITNNTKDDTWILGTNFIKKYITVFDYETKTLSFFGENIKKYIPEYKSIKSTLYILYLLISLLLFIFIINLICFKIKLL